MVKVEMFLVKPAKKKGGDRYEGIVKDENLVVYIPQSISRPKGAPRQKIVLTFDVKDN